PSSRVTCFASRIASVVPARRMIATPTTPSSTIAATLTSAKRPTAPVTDVRAATGPWRRGPSFPLISTSRARSSGRELDQLLPEPPVEARAGKLSEPHDVRAKQNLHL